MQENQDIRNEQGGTPKTMSYVSRYSAKYRNNPYYKWHKNIKEKIEEEISASQINFSGNVIKDELNPKIWDENKKLRPEVRKKLIKIAKHFYDFLKLEVKVKDIIVTGSMANYNWTEHSDIDLHLIIPYKEVDENTELVTEYFEDKKKLWGEIHDIKIHGFDVELYAQDTTQEAKKDAATYSIVQNEWLIEPNKVEVSVDVDSVKKKAAAIINMIEDLPNEKDGEKLVNKAKKIKDKIKRLRKTGLEQGGEYAPENLAFKVLRNQGYLQKLTDLSTKALDAALSLEEKFASKAQQRYFYAQAEKGGKEGKKWKKMADEFAADTNFSELPNKVNEAMGLNPIIDSAAKFITDNTRNYLIENLNLIFDKVEKNDEKNGLIGLSLIIPPGLLKQFENLFKTRDIDIKLRFNKTIGYSIGGSYKFTNDDNKVLINIIYSMDLQWFNDPKRKIKFLKEFDENFNSVLVHELTHALEYRSRKRSGETEEHNTNYRLKNAFEELKDAYILKDLGRYFYYSSNDEINARVAEIGAIVNALPADMTVDEVVGHIYKSGAWGDMDFLSRFNYFEMYKKVKALIVQNLEKEEFNEELIKRLTNDFIVDVVGDVIKKKVEAGKKDGDTAVLLGILRNKDGKKILWELQKYFIRKSEIMKKRMLKTVGLHLVKDKEVNEDSIPGGKADRRKPGEFDQRELRMGIEVEKEHTKSYTQAREIAMDHLAEDPKYYTKLKKCGLADELRESNDMSEKMMLPPGEAPADEKEYEVKNRTKNVLEVQEGIEGMNDEKIKMIITFIKFCCKKLHLKNPVKVVLRRGRDEYIVTTASYLPGEDENHIRCGGRSVVDICRSIAHELTHNRQREKGMIKPGVPVQNIGGEIESEADTMAGILIKDFTHNHGYDAIYDM